MNVSSTIGRGRNIALAIVAAITFFVLSASSAYAATIPDELWQFNPANGWRCTPALNANPQTGTCQHHDGTRVSFSCSATEASQAPSERDCTITQIESTDPDSGFVADAANAVAEVGAEFGQGTISAVLQPVIGLSYLILAFANFLLFLAGGLFNIVFVETVLQFGTNFGNSDGLLAAWGVLRDIGNILLLFGFVFMGIATILNLHDYTVKKTLPRLIIFAVLLNFSLFAAEAMIDVTNGISAAISAQTTAVETCENVTGGTGASAQEQCAKQYGISGSIMDASGLASSFRVDYNPANFFDLNESVKTVTVLLGLILFSTILTVVFFAITIMLIIRVVVLVLVMVTSPIGFAGMAVPFLKSAATHWWKELINQSVFVPVFLLLVFVGLKVIEASPLAASRQNGIAEALESGDISVLGILLTFALVVGFMLAALMAAKKFGARGADFAIKTAGGLTYGSMGFVGRRTFGQAALNMASGWRRAAAMDNKFLGQLARSPLGRPVGQLLDRGAKSSFDMRGIGPLKTGFGGVGVDVGEASHAAKGGIQEIIKEEKEKKMEHFEAIHEEVDRYVDVRMEKYNNAKDRFDKAGGEKAVAAGDKTAIRLKAEKEDAKAIVSQTEEGKKRLMEEQRDDLAKAMKALTKTLQTVQARRQAAETNAAAARGRGDVVAAAGFERAATAAQAEEAGLSTQLALQTRQSERLTEALEHLEDEIRQEKLRYAEQLNRSADWWIAPSVGYRADREAAIEMRRLVGRSKADKQYETLLGAVKGLKGGGDTHGGASKSTFFGDIEASSEGHGHA